MTRTAPSVFDDPREVLEPPTREEFLARIGEPQLAFTLDQSQINVPLGLLGCCRVVHQPHCEHHVASSLFDCLFTIEYPDGRVSERRPLKRTFSGDVLARPEDLSGAVQVVALQAAAQAEAEDGQITEMGFGVWTLNLEMAEIWRYLEEQREIEDQHLLERYDTMADVEIESLAVEILSDEDGPVRVARVQADPTFRPLRSYAHRVLVLPHEIGHDDRARYVTSEIWGQPNVVPPAVEAIRRDPSEARS